MTNTLQAVNLQHCAGEDSVDDKDMSRALSEPAIMEKMKTTRAGLKATRL